MESKPHECTATSTTEAEYITASGAAKEALWLGRLAHTFRQVDSDLVPIVYNDSHHNASKCCCFVEKSGPSQRLQAYRSSISLCSGLRHFRKNRFREDIHNRQCCRWNDQVSFGGSFPIPSATNGRNEKSVRLKSNTQDGFSANRQRLFEDRLQLFRLRPVRPSFSEFCRLGKNRLV